MTPNIIWNLIVILSFLSFLCIHSKYYSGAHRLCVPSKQLSTSLEHHWSVVLPNWRLHHTELAFSQAYQAVSKEILQEIGVLLDINRERQRDLQDSNNRITMGGKNNKSRSSWSRWAKIVENTLSIFGAPYFEDLAYKFPPDNDYT